MATDARDARLDDGSLERPGLLARSAPVLAIVALVISALALADLVIGPASGGAADLSGCRSQAWKAVPDAADLPDSWSVGSTDLNADGITISISGPAPADQNAQPPAVYATVTCYGSGAAAALAANRSAADARGATVTSRGRGDDAYDVDDPASGSTTTLFRVGALVAQIATVGEVSASDTSAIAVAVATAMGDQSAAGSTVAQASGDTGDASAQPSGDGSSTEPSATPFAPELEALLPTQIADPTSTTSPPASIALTIDSASAADLFGQDPSSRAIAAWVRSLGATLDDLQIAQASDETGSVDLSILAFRLPGKDGSKLRSAILDAWLSSGSTGVRTASATVGGKAVTTVDYGDGGAIDYVYREGDAVIDVETSDSTLAAAVLSKVK